MTRYEVHEVHIHFTTRHCRLQYGTIVCPAQVELALAGEEVGVGVEVDVGLLTSIKLGPRQLEEGNVHNSTEPISQQYMGD